MLEGTSLQMRWLADEVEAALGVPFDNIRFVGGGALSDLWASIMADVLGRPIDQLDQPAPCQCTRCRSDGIRRPPVGWRSTSSPPWFLFGHGTNRTLRLVHCGTTGWVCIATCIAVLAEPVSRLHR